MLGARLQPDEVRAVTEHHQHGHAAIGAVPHNFVLGQILPVFSLIAPGATSITTGLGATLDCHHGLQASDPTRIGTMGQPNPSQTLTREERIRRRPEFLYIQQRGVRTRGRYMTLIGLSNARMLSRLGIVAPRRLGKAVRRNRSKRRVRELFRYNKPVAGFDLVVLPRREFLDAPFVILLDDYRRTLQRQVRAHSSS